MTRDAGRVLILTALLAAGACGAAGAWWCWSSGWPLSGWAVALGTVATLGGLSVLLWPELRP